MGSEMCIRDSTYTVALEDNKYTIHALDKSFTEGIEESVFVKQLRKLEE